MTRIDPPAAGDRPVPGSSAARSAGARRERLDPGRLARTGLSAAEVAARIEAGEVNDAGDPPTRSIRDIVRSNVLTRFNFLIGGLLVVILVVAPIQDALFALVAFANTVIGIAQEIRAKQTLDRLAVVNAPQARVVRDGEVVELDVAEVVLDDVLLLAPGDQLPVDGVVLAASGLEANESLVTGESDAIAKRRGDKVLSGSFVVAGSGRIRTTALGSESFAGRLTEEARSFELAVSELRAGIDRIIKVVTWILVPTAVVLVVTQLLHAQSVQQALAGAVAGTVAIIPEGLVLLTSLAFAAAVVRLARQEVLVQELPAVETLARVDVVCFDKTGTLTTGEIRLKQVVALPGAGDVEAAVAALAAADPEPNATLQAIADAYPVPRGGWVAVETVPFSSARKWSAARFSGQGTWVFGAPDVLLADVEVDPEVATRLRRAIATGARIVLLAATSAPLDGERLPPGLRPQALVALTETVREDAIDTIGYFVRQGVRPLLISGDHPRTVAAVARRVGLDVDVAVAGRDLPEDDDALADVLAEHQVFGRVTPDHKRALVRSLQSRGYVVAMTGDGVNDVLALKDADIGIAMGSGAAATRNVSQLVMMDDDFSSLPSVVAEGRRVIGNIERVANLFLTKTVYATLLALAIGLAQLPFPFLPRHLSLVGGLTIGIPGFFLALQPNERKAGPGFVKRAVGFALPAGIAAAAATFAAYWIAQTVEQVGLDQARTTATITLYGLGLLVLRLLCRPLNPVRRLIVVGSGLLFLLALLLEVSRTFFALHPPPVVLLLASVGIVAVAALVMETTAVLVEMGHRAYRRRAGHRADDGHDRGQDPAQTT